MGFELHLNNWPNADILALALFSVTIKGSRSLARTRLYMYTWGVKPAIFCYCFCFFLN